MVEKIVRNISIALRQIDAEVERELALIQIRRNLKHFEFLADKLRNPLAAIKGFLEIRDEIGDYEMIFNMLETQAKRIEELRKEESLTYLIDELFKRE